MSADNNVVADKPLSHKQIIDIIAAQKDESISLIHDIVTAYQDLIVHQLIELGRFNIRSLGTFKVVTRAPRNSIHPSSRERLYIPERKAVNFKPAPSLKDSLNED